jgi:NAD(P)-dependent dehydrogenase (short-subunit alcohol dehydrogenase family)
MRSVVVTGASTGIGASLVGALVASRFHVWATVRREQDADDLRSRHGNAVSPLLVDLTDEASVRVAGEQVRTAGPLFGLVNNAGVALPAPLEHVPLDAFRRQLEVNLVGQLAVTQAMLPALREGRARGQEARIVMVGSIGGRIAGPMLGAYHTSKFGLLGLTDSLRAELAPWGMRVILVEPGAVATPIWQRGRSVADETLAKLPDEGRKRYDKAIGRAIAEAESAERRGLPPAQAAKVIVRALTASNPRPRYLVGTDAKIASNVARLPHRLRYRLVAARGMSG